MITLLCVVLIALGLCLGAGYVLYLIFKGDEDV